MPWHENNNTGPKISGMLHKVIYLYIYLVKYLYLVSEFILTN